MKNIVNKIFILTAFFISQVNAMEDPSENDQWSEIKQLLESNPQALHDACKKGDIEKTQLLIEAGANIQRRIFSGEHRGWMPMHIACYYGYYDIVKALIKAGARINVPYNHSLLNEADTARYSPLHLAAFTGNLPVVELLIKHGAKINARVTKGKYTAETPLHLAARSNANAVAQLLLTNNAQINQFNDVGYSPLHLAIHDGYAEVVKVLIDYGADPNYPVSTGRYTSWAPIHLTVFNKIDAIAEYLINRGANINAVTNRNRTPLHLFIKHDRPIEHIYLLLTHGALCNVQDNEGNTPLHYAAKKPRAALTKLLQLFCDKTIKNNAGKTAADLLPFETPPSVYEAFMGNEVVIQNARDKYIKYLSSKEYKSRNITQAVFSSQITGKRNTLT